MSEVIALDSMSSHLVESEAHGVQANRAELVERIARANCEDATIEPLKGPYLYRSSSLKKLHSISNPAFCVVAQGHK